MLLLSKPLKLYAVNNKSIIDTHTVSTAAVVGLPCEQYIFLSLVAMPRDVSLREIDKSHILY